MCIPLPCSPNSSPLCYISLGKYYKFFTACPSAARKKQRLANFFCRGLDGILGFADQGVYHDYSTLFQPGSSYRQCISEQRDVPIKLYLKKQGLSHIWPASWSASTSGLKLCKTIFASLRSATMSTPPSLVASRLTPKAKPQQGQNRETGPPDPPPRRNSTQTQDILRPG